MRPEAPHSRGQCENPGVSEVRQQGLIGAPPNVVWEVIVDVDRHPKWWPGAIEVECEDFGEDFGETFVDAAAGMDPTSPRYQLMDLFTGRLYFRRWLKQWFEALDHEAAKREAVR